MNASRQAKQTLRAEIVTLARGSGGKAMHDLIDAVFVSEFDNDFLAPLEDQARFDLSTLGRHGNRLAFTTDSYVVDPLFFPGGDIGKLAVTGTVNDLAVGGAKPLYLSCGMIIEEGLAVNELRKIVQSMKKTADQAGVMIVTGNTKVVPRGAADKLFINTASVGVIPAGINLSSSNAQVNNVIIINGYVGNHGAAIVDARGEMALENAIMSDCQTLNGLVEEILKMCPETRCMRDATVVVLRPC